MPLEDAQYIHQLNSSYPGGGDKKSQGDDHIKLMKGVLKRTFPNLQGAVTKSHAQLNATPHDKATLVELFGQKIVSSEQFAGVGAAQDIAFGFDTVTGRLRAKVGTNIITNALAFLSDVASGSMSDNATVNLGSGLVLKRYGAYVGSGQFTVTFTPELAEVPFMILPMALQGYDGAAAYGPGFAGQWSVGNPCAVSDRSATGCTINVGADRPGLTRIAVYVLGKLK